MGVQDNFAGLQNVADQYAPQPRQHHGPSAGAIVTTAVIGGLIYRNAKQRAQVRNGERPVGLKPTDDLAWYVLGAAVAHVLLGSLAMLLIWTGPVAFWLVYGSLIWIPAWILGFRHQARVRAHNDAVWYRFNNPAGPATVTVEQIAPAVKVSDGFDAWYRAQKK